MEVGEVAMLLSPTNQLIHTRHLYYHHLYLGHTT